MENKKRRVLFIVNTQFPYGKSEDFLSNELEYDSDFDEIVCFPVLVYGTRTSEDIIYKKPKQSVIFYNSMFSYKNKSRFLKLLFLTCTDLNLYKELLVLVRTKRLTFGNIKQLFVFLFIAHNALHDLTHIIKEKYKDCDIVLYSYWMYISAYVVVSLKKKLQKVIYFEKEITRCHRFDLYEYANAGRYLPMRKYILSEITEIHSISTDGVDYLNKKYPNESNKLKLSRLGSIDKGINVLPKTETLHLVSCSWMRPVKRVSAIVEAISTLSVKVDWVHYGDGEEFEKIQKLVQKINNPLVNVKLLGACSNEKVLQEYACKKYDVFINVSKNEGVPVSIMEAMSFGKIIIATNVGGTAEIVEHGVNGFLLNKDFTNEELVNVLNIIALLEPEEFTKMCKQSREIWEERCNAPANYKKFYQQMEADIIV